MLAGFLLNKQEADWRLADGIEKMRASVVSLSLILDSYKLSEKLFKESEDCDNIMIRREEVFKELDYEALYERLAEMNAVLPGRLYWDEVTEAVQRGGINSGRRVLAKSVRGLRTTLRSYSEELVKLQSHRLEGRTKALHRQTKSGAAIHHEWLKLTTQCIYLTQCVQEGSVRTHEQSQA